jgi:hypothetical protein
MCHVVLSQPFFCPYLTPEVKERHRVVQSAGKFLQFLFDGFFSFLIRVLILDIGSDVFWIQREIFVFPELHMVVHC